MNKIQVLVVDDSPLMQSLLCKILNSSNDIQVVGTAADPYEARDKIKQLKPDVVTLDIEMPKMDGITFLRNLMRLNPLPVIMISTLTERGSRIALQALELGAIDFVPKPKVNLSSELGKYTDEILHKIRLASKASVRALAKVSNKAPAPAAPSEPVEKVTMSPLLAEKLNRKMIAIGSSTGGTDALKDVLMGFPAASPPIMVTQHIPEFISASFAKRLDAICQVKVVEAQDGMPIEPGTAYIAPGGRHLEIFNNRNGYICKVFDGPKVNDHKPSVDVLFNSIAKTHGRNAIGVILTGMGNDGAQGLKNMRDMGSHTIAQDEKTCVVYGMPKCAVELGAAKHVLPLKKIAPKVNDCVKS